MKIKEYINKHEESISAFAAKANVDRQVIYRAFAGSQIHLEKALAIVKASDGLVTLEDLLSKESKEFLAKIE